ncbi:unnamed protein product [Mytilus coruscus]|uniref:LRRCT domain-containing protein n=1 Tax=Mytilus coruscus TaxID=42192 RepID=A0A6J8E7L8_MYTCO|nr:unnamed protein product [Mytilus coruscus]
MGLCSFQSCRFHVTILLCILSIHQMTTENRNKLQVSKKSHQLSGYVLNNISFSILQPWQQFCYINDLPKQDKPGEYYIEIICNVDSNVLNFLDFRRFTSKIQENILFSVVITCSHNGSVFFPYPGRARLLHSLRISNCVLNGFTSEATSDVIDSITDRIKYFTLVNSVIFMSQNDFRQFQEAKHLTKAFQCGNVNAVKIIEYNISCWIGNVSKRIRLETYHTRPDFHDRTCTYKYLRHLQKSFSIIQPFTRQIDKSMYPNIEILNFSAASIIETPKHFQEWRLESKDLKYLDLSHNFIEDVFPIICHDKYNDNTTEGFVDLRYNNISSLRLHGATRWFHSICDKLTVDIRNNPFLCDCGVKYFQDLLQKHIENHTASSYLYMRRRNVTRYKYLYDLTCYNPPSLRGRIISELSLSEIGCKPKLQIVTNVPTGPVIVVMLISFFLSVCLFVGIRYREQIVVSCNVATLKIYVSSRVEILNFSAASIIETPKHFQEWRLESKDLKYLDLSHNFIEDVFPIICHDKYNDNTTEGFVDLRYNNISSLRLHGATRWFHSICDKLTVDIRNNPFLCDCGVKYFQDLLQKHIENHTASSYLYMRRRNVTRYKYLYDLTCYNPPSLRGRIISKLSLSEIGCKPKLQIVTNVPTGPVIVVMLISFFLSVCLFVGIRYREQIVVSCSKSFCRS